MSSFHFLQPWALLSAPVLFALGWWALQQQVGTQVWQRVFNAELLPRFLSDSVAMQTRSAQLLTGLVSLLLAVALAQPVWRLLPQPVFKAESALVIALDLSASMNAKDIAPSRLKLAQFKIRDLLAQRKEGQTALLVYAGDAFSVTPLTDDTATLASQLNALEPGIMPVQGSRPEKALALADQLLSQAGIRGGDILLIGDALSSAPLTDQLGQLQQQGRRVSVLAIGTEAGAPVPGIRYRDGKPVIAGMDSAQMQQVAQLGGGIAPALSADNGDIDQLAALFHGGADQRQAQPTDQTSDQWVADGRWFILLALPLLLPLYRRGVLGLALPLLAASMLLTPAKPAMAADWQQRWDDLWQRPDQQAMQQWQAGDKAAAAAQFEQPDWQQAAQYSQGNYQQALDSLPTPKTSDQWYNRANALARLGQFDQALKAYDEALKLNPDNQDAQSNRQLVEQAKKQLEQQQPPQDQNQQQDKQQGQDQQGSDKESSDKGSDKKGEQSDSDQQAGDGESSDQDQQSADNSENSGDPSEQDQQSPSEQSASDTESDTQSDAQSQENSGQSAAENTEQSPDQAQQQAFSDAVDESAQQDTAPPSTPVAAPDDSAPMNEEQQAREQLLNRVVDDPAGLWRRKFLYQYQQQQQPAQPGEQPW